MSQTCPRVWQVEAIEDGRLGGQDSASLMRHAEGCADCARELAALSDLRTAVSAIPVLTSGPFERRRLRSEVLKRADRARFAIHAEWRHRFAFALAAALIASLTIVGLRRSPNERPLPAASSVAPSPIAPQFEMDAEPRAEWAPGSDGPTVRRKLVRGRFAFHVPKLEAGQRFVLDLPDGELEVKGTRFVVTVEDAETTSVVCSEGRVALRLHGRNESIIEAGGSWEKAKPAAPPSASARPRVAVPPSRGEAFVAAMNAFTAGEFELAERLFREFAAKHPADARAEDAAFLRVVSRSRSGDREGARVVAREYLERYPNGLRRREAEALVR